jgi:parallel beta-helix repeat protein
MKTKLITTIMIMLFLASITAIVIPVQAGVAKPIHVYPGQSIQTAVDLAGIGGTVIVHSGVYHQTIMLTVAHNGLTLISDGAILDGDGAANNEAQLVDAITIDKCVKGVTIKNFEIREYRGTGNGQGNGIQAWNDGTSDIKVIGNTIHDNSWNAILVGNEGTGLHEHWSVKDNVIYGNGFYSLELTNAKNSVIAGNTVEGGYAGILIQARNTIPRTGVFDPANVRVTGNEVSGAVVGIYVIALVSEPTEPFNPISDAYTELRTVVLADNNVHDNAQFGIYGWGYYGVLAGVTITNNEVMNNGAYHGIVLNNAEWSKVANNEVSGSGMDGIALYGGSSNNKVSDNDAHNNGRYGISVRGVSSYNTISDNIVLNNVVLDLHWDGTGTDNVWKDNTYGTKSPNIP